MTQLVTETCTASDVSSNDSHVLNPTSGHELSLEASHDRLDAAFSSLFSEIENRISALVEAGIEPGYVATYPKGGRTYYNHCYDNAKGKPIRKYLSRSRLAATRAAIARHRQVERLKQMRSEIERIWFNAKGEI